MGKIKVGVVGVGRGGMMMSYCEKEQHAKLVAICDKWAEGLEIKKNELNDPDISYYTDYEDFLKHDMDVVMLANYAHQHAPFAIKAMKAGFHVISEVLPCLTMKEAVELIETIEQTGMVYAYVDPEKLWGNGFPYSSSAFRYVVNYYTYRGNSTTSLSSSALICSHTSSETNNAANLYPRYWATETGFQPYTNSTSRYWRSGRTYSWIAIWKP